MVYYPNPKNIGVTVVGSNGDGYTINVSWYTAYPNNPKNKIAYHIYYSTNIDNVFSEGVKFVSIDGSTNADIFDFIPGQLYYFAVRAVEYDPIIVNPALLPVAFSGLAVYPESLLRSNMTADQTTVTLIDVATFPAYGLVKAGAELIEYLSVDHLNNNLIVPGGASAGPASLVDLGGGYFYLPASTNTGNGVINSLTLTNISSAPTETWTIKCIEIGDGYNKYNKFEAIGSVTGALRDGYTNEIIWTDNNIVVTSSILSFSIQSGNIPFGLGDYFTVKVVGATNATFVGRGFYNTTPRIHNTDGYDGYMTWNPNISFILGREETNTKKAEAQSHFEFFNYQYTITDGYHQTTKDILTTDLAGSDASNVGFNSYDYAGWHRIDPTLMLNGECVGLYIGGEQYCVDGYDGVGRVLRGISFQERNNQRQEMLLGVTGEPVVLLRRQWTGITCDCYLPSSEYPDDRCPKCYGTKFVVGWDQYFNPRISSGRIMVKFSPADDIVKQYDSGLESEMFADVWTMVVPTVKQRDIIVRFDQDGNEEFRYEVINVNRNRTLDQLSGGQHFRVQRIRKSDVAYQIPVLRNTQYLPQIITTGVSSSAGILPHTHTIEINEVYTKGAAQLTSQNQGHNHPVSMINGIAVVSIVLGHTHSLPL